MVGIRHHILSDKLEMDSELTLEKAINKIRQYEEIKKQQPKHYAAVCKCGRVGAVLEAEEEYILFLGAISKGKKPETWEKTLKVNGQDITFKLDTGADSTVIPVNAYSEKVARLRSVSWCYE